MMQAAATFPHAGAALDVGRSLFRAGCISAWSTRRSPDGITVRVRVGKRWFDLLADDPLLERVAPSVERV